MTPAIPVLESRQLTWAARGVVILAALLLAVGALTLLPPLSSRPGAYLADRNLGLAVLLVVLLALGWYRSLGAVLLATALIHSFDGVADIAFGNPPAAIGSFVLAVLSAAAALWFLRQQGSAGAKA